MTLYAAGLAIGALGSLVIGWATVATAMYLRRIKGEPFTQTVPADELDSAMRTHVHNKRVITCVAKMPNGTVMISGR